KAKLASTPTSAPMPNQRSVTIANMVRQEMSRPVAAAIIEKPATISSDPEMLPSLKASPIDDVSMSLIRAPSFDAARLAASSRASQLPRAQIASVDPLDQCFPNGGGAQRQSKKQSTPAVLMQW